VVLSKWLNILVYLGFLMAVRRFCRLKFLWCNVH